MIRRPPRSTLFPYTTLFRSGLVVPGADPVNRVTIVPRGQALGVTYQRPEDDRYNYPEAYLRARIIGALGGRSAEEIVYGTRTTGARSEERRVGKECRSRWSPYH